MIELYKDGDHMAISTDAKDERQFLDELSHLLSEMIHLWARIKRKVKKNGKTA